MGQKSKTKGNAGERELAKILSERLGGNFTRVPSSGAFVGGKNAYRAGQLSETQNRIYRGDLIPPDHLSRMVIESKSYAEFPFHALLTPGPVPQLEEWIAQVTGTLQDGDTWFVCFKITRKGWFVATAFRPDYALGNHTRYQGDILVTSLSEFFEVNKDIVVRECA